MIKSNSISKFFDSFSFVIYLLSKTCKTKSFYSHYNTICELIRIGCLYTHIMFYKERFIRNAFLTSQIFKDFKEQTSQFQKN